MDIATKQRLIGAVVVIGAAVLILPWLLDGPPPENRVEAATKATMADQAPTEVRIIRLDKPAPIEAASADDRMTADEKKARNETAYLSAQQAKNAAAAQSPAADQKPPKVVRPAPPKPRTLPNETARPKPKPESKPRPQPRPAPKPRVVKPDPAPSSGGKAGKLAWAVQLGAFGSKANAQRYADQLAGNLSNRGLKPYIESVGTGAKRRYHVRVPGASNRKDAASRAQKLKDELGLSVVVVPQD